MLAGPVTGQHGGRRTMSRRSKPYTSSEIQAIRGNWYAAHYERRSIAKSISETDTDLARAYRFINAQIHAPGLGIVGNPFDPEKELLPGIFGIWPPSAAFVAANRTFRYNDIDWSLLVSWYWSAEGWSIFQELWKNLPEPVDFIHMGMCTTQEVVQLVHIKNMPDAPASP
jgi:hypothetical protein